MKKLRRSLVGSIVLAAIAVLGAHAADAEPEPPGFTVIPGAVAGNSPDGLGTWRVDYQRIAGGAPAIATAVNEGIDADAMRQVQHITWNGSTRRPWTFDATGTAYFGPITVSELFTGKYDTEEPTMPLETVSTVVFDTRSGALITWDNIFRDRRAGLTRLAEQTAAILPTKYAEPHPGRWQSSGALAPIDINFKYWIPTAGGIELHFPDHQFGRGLKVITVPWAQVADLIAPEFLPLMR